MSAYVYRVNVAMNKYVLPVYKFINKTYNSI